ncbi:MAG: hypothetical protein JWO98_2453 [Frankiales bacterium]|nr:hypothetical protein [Frankiales bacterium]
MKLTVISTEPVQEIAAEAATLDVLTASLRARLTKAFGPEPVTTGEIGSLYGFPLVTDPALPPGEVHMRPTPGAPPPASPDEIAAMLAVFSPQGDGNALLGEVAR